MAKNEELMRIVGKIKYTYNLNQTEIAEKIGVSKQYLSDTINCRYPFSEDLRQRLCKTFPNIFNEVHSVSIEHESEPYTETKNGVKYLRRDDGKLLMELPIVPVFALGSQEGEELLQRDEADKATFEVDKVGYGKYFAFEVDGDSMDNGARESFARGDVVLVRELDKQDWLPHLHIGRWKYWVVCWGNNVRLKQIVNHTGETITLHSLNPSPEYTDFVLNLDEVSRLFNVIRKNPRSEKY